MKKNVLLIITGALCFWSCFSSSSDTEAVVETNRIQNKVSMENPNQDAIMSISLKDALKKYGEPEARETFNVRYDAITEFRIELLNYLSQEEINRGLIIDELTWETDSINNITVWYTQRENQFWPLHLLIWDKRSEF